MKIKSRYRFDICDLTTDEFIVIHEAVARHAMEVSDTNDVKRKTNEENIKGLSGKSLACFLGNYFDDCRTCVYKSYETCSKIEDRLSCLEGRMAWLERFTHENDDDVFMFTASRQNVNVGQYNKELYSDE